MSVRLNSAFYNCGFLSEKYNFNKIKTSFGIMIIFHFVFLEAFDEIDIFLFFN